MTTNTKPPAVARPVTILHLEDNQHDREIIRETLTADGLECDVRHAETRDDFVRAISGGDIDLIVSDHALPAFDGTRALQLARQLSPETPFIFLTGSLGEESAVEKMRSGATDYVLKHRLERLVPAIRRALEEAEERTRREQAEEELRRSDELLRQISDNIQDLIAILDTEGRRLYNSASYRSLLGDPATLKGTESFLSIHPEDRSRMRQIFEQTVATGLGQRTEYRLVTLDGNVRHVESQGSVIRDREGKVINVLVVSRDITERRHAERHIREQAALLQQAHDAIFVHDLNQAITYWNHGAETLYGWTSVETAGQNADTLLFRDGTAAVADIRRELMEKGAWSGEAKHFTKAGREVLVESSRTLLYNEAGRPYCVLNINTDVTEKRQIREQLLRTQRMESIGALAGGIAHDLNNVLSPILMAADLLREEVTSESGQMMLDTMKTSAQRGSEMVRQILSFARGTGGESSVLQPKHLLVEMSQLAKETFPQSITIRTDISVKLQPVVGNPTQIHQVLLNLCVNARDAMPAGGLLHLAAENVVLAEKHFRGHPQPVSGAFVRISVADTGIGIPPHLRERIFEPFFTTKGAGKGTGIGLSTVVGIISSHNGFIEVESEAGKGTKFMVYFPASEKMPGPAGAAKRQPPPGGRGEMILLVDDEMGMLEITKETLESFNYRVVTATNGADALVLYHRHRSELKALVTDLLMPIMDGGTLVRMLRQVDPQIRIVTVSGQSANPNLTPAPVPDVQAHLPKPFATEAILTVLHDVLAK